MGSLPKPYFFFDDLTAVKGSVLRCARPVAGNDVSQYVVGARLEY